MKVLKTIFIFSLFVIFIELVYFFLIINKINNYKNYVKNKNYVKKNSPLYEEIFSSKDFNNYLKKLGFFADNKLLTNFIVTEEYEGIITDIKIEPGIEKGYKYSLKLTIKSPKTKIFTTRLLNDRDLSILKFYDNKKREIHYKKLKIGDYIKISFSSDYLKPPKINLISGYIEKK